MQYNKWVKQFILLLLFFALRYQISHWLGRGWKVPKQSTHYRNKAHPPKDGTLIGKTSDSGDRARIFTKQAGIDLGQLQFPKPTIIPVDPLIAYGYNDNVTYTSINNPMKS